VSDSDNDEALTWAGGRDPSHYETPEPKEPKQSKTPKPSTKVTGIATVGDEDDELRPPMSAVVLVSLGLLGGVYLLYTIGLLVSWQRLIYTDPDTLELAAFRAQQVLALLAAPLWFVLTLLFTRERKPAVRLLWLVIGAIVLIPWSFTFGR
jgi:hypothetical protein